MPSFDTVNYSLRPSKNIQRQLVFDGVRRLQQELDLERLAYIGFGSIWFTDFAMAHTLLRVTDMVSMEGNDIGYRRAVFNAPYATVRVKEGFSYQVLPSLYTDELLTGRPWLVWLDYDYSLNESVRDDIRSITENAPASSIVLITFNGRANSYGSARDRPGRLAQILGSVVPDDLSKDACSDDRIQDTLADLTLDFIKSAAADLARPGGFVPAFRLIYKDSTPMITVGGILPTKGAARVATDIVDETTWPCRPQKPIKAPNLTIREAVALQSQLPCVDRLSRDTVRTLGFDLEDEQIEAFETYYRQYPAFAQIIA
jgi:hypothetical protein